MKKRDHDIAKDCSEEDVGQQPGQVSPTIDELSSVRGTRHFKVETQHILTCFSQHKNPVTRHERGALVFSLNLRTCSYAG